MLLPAITVHRNSLPEKKQDDKPDVFWDIGMKQETCQQTPIEMDVIGNGEQHVFSKMCAEHYKRKERLNPIQYKCIIQIRSVKKSASKSLAVRNFHFTFRPMQNLLLFGYFIQNIVPLLGKSRQMWSIDNTNRLDLIASNKNKCFGHA